MKKSILAVMFLIAGFSYVGCDEEDYCYRENLVIYDVGSDDAFQCKHGSWEMAHCCITSTYREDPEGICRLLCKDKANRDANRDWCDRHHCK